MPPLGLKGIDGAGLDIRDKAFGEKGSGNQSSILQKSLL